MQSPRYRRATAFTLLEVIIAISIIVVLAGLFLMGMKGMIGGSKAKATMVTLQALQGMLGELDAKTHLAKAPPAWLWWDNAGALNTVASGGGFDLWRTPARFPSPAYRDPDSLGAPGLVASDNGQIDDGQNLDRNASPAVLNTQLVMNLIMSMPENRAALQKTAADRYFTPTWVGGSLISPGSDGGMHTADDTNAPVGYLVGNRMQFEGKKYLCVANFASPSMPSAGSTPPSASFVADNSPPVPLLLDAWNNPIIFVPATGLRVQLLNGAKSYGNVDPGGKYSGIPNEVKTTIIISPEGRVGVDPSDSTKMKVFQPGRPFWASAGPDGDFAKGDDNIYSFEK